MSSTPAGSSEWDFPNRVTPVGSAAYYAVRFSPRSLRRRNALLYAWYRLIQDITDKPLDPGAARLKLDWWRQEAVNITAGTVRHPLAIALQQTDLVESSTVPMVALIDSAEEQIRGGPPADDDDFVAYCRGGMGNLFLLLAEQEHTAGVPTGVCRDWGAYCEAVEHIRLLARSPHRLPEALQAEQLQKLEPADRDARLRRLFDRLGDADEKLVAQLPDFARRLIALSRAMHSKLRHSGYPATEPAPDRAPIANLWTAWRCR